MQAQPISVASGHAAALSASADRVGARAAGRRLLRLAGARQRAFGLLLLLGLGACGQKGALYLPAAPAAAASAVPLTGERPPARVDNPRNP